MTIDHYLLIPVLRALLLLLVAVAAGEGLIAVWAATSRAHWFLHALAVWGGVMLLLPVRVYEPAVVFAIAGPLTVGWLLIARRSRQPAASPQRGRLRYGVRDLMLLMVLVALVIIGIQANPAIQAFDARDWLASAVCGALLSATVALAASIVIGRRRLTSLVALIGVISIAAWAVPKTTADTKVASTWQAVGLLWDKFSLSEVPHFAGCFAFLAIVVAGTIGLSVLATRATSTRGRRAARVVLGFAGLALAIPCTWLYWQMLWLSPLPPEFTGPTNHYPRVVTIASAFQNLGSARPETQALYRSFVDEAVELAAAPSFVPWDLEKDATRKEFELRMQSIVSLRQLGRTLEGESNGAAMNGDYARARELSIANIRLGVMFNRGGTILEALVGIALDGIGQSSLAAMRFNLPPDEARVVISELQRALDEVEDETAIAYRDRAFTERAYGWPARLESVALALADEQSPAEQAFNAALLRRNTENLLLQADLAARLFHHEQGRWPSSLEELMPTYLPAVPVDPYSVDGQPLRYRAEDDGFVLYSVGMDQADNGGKYGNFQTYFAGGYDFDLDTRSRP